MNIEFTKDELLLLLDNVDFCQDNKESYDEYSIIDVNLSLLIGSPLTIPYLL